MFSTPKILRPLSLRRALPAKVRKATRGLPSGRAVAARGGRATVSVAKRAAR